MAYYCSATVASKWNAADLNLFRVFDAVVRLLSVSAASRELDVTASAVSHALSRLRKVLGDERFIFGDLGMAPTARALELAPAVQDALPRLATTIDTEAFAPERSVRTFALACTDNTAVTILPKLVSQLLLKAPQVSLRVFPFSRMDVVRQLDEGRLDLVLGWFADLPDRTRRTPIYTEQEAMVVRSGHSLTRGEVTKKRLFGFPHIVVELTGSENQALDGFIDDRGVIRRVWIERLLIDMSDKDQSLVGLVAVTRPPLWVDPAHAATDGSGGDVTAPLGCPGGPNTCACLAGPALRSAGRYG